MTRKMKLVSGCICLAAAALLVYGWGAAGLGHGATEGMEAEEALEKVNPVGPEFNADSAYAFTQAQ